MEYVYQAPLTHRKSGPGLILVSPGRYSDTSLAGASPRHLDPPPAQKWAEEGFCVLEVNFPANGDREGLCDDWATIISRSVEQLREKPELSGRKFGLIVYDSSVVYEVLSNSKFPQDICCVVAFLDQKGVLATKNSTTCPLLRHISVFSPISKQPLVQGVSVEHPTTHNATISTTTYEYARPGLSPEPPQSNNSPSFIHPFSSNYNHIYATLAHTRTLTFLRSHIEGPHFDIEAIWEAHTQFEFDGRNVEGTMGTMVAEPYVNHIPTLTGGIGRAALTRFYAQHFIHSNPTSTRMELVSRTIGPDRVVDEFIFEFVHDMEMDWMLPGVPPTGKHVRVPFVAVVNVRGDKLYHEHIYWDQASVLVQIGLLPSHLVFPGTKQEIKLPVAGIDQAIKVLDPGARESNLLMKSER